MSHDPEQRAHRDWIGLLQPVGLVVSPPALAAAQAHPDKNIHAVQRTLAALIAPLPKKPGEKPAPDALPRPLGFADLATQVLGWPESKLVGRPDGPPLPETLSVVLPEFGETLRPTYAVPALAEDGTPWLLLVDERPDGTPLDKAPPEGTLGWRESPEVRFERLLRDTGVPIGILTNGRLLRLVYCPRGESSGHITWPIHRLLTAMGREMLSALHMLLGKARLFTVGRDQRLPHILRESRKYQSVVSTKLASQVLEGLNELLRGFSAANAAQKGALLDRSVSEQPDHLYGGLLAVLLRLVFVLYAEERGLLSTSPVYVRGYSLVGLFDQLRGDQGRFPDTLDQRYGAWSRLLVLFRLIHDGARRGDFVLPPRYGHLFDPDGWPFLEGRPFEHKRERETTVPVPKVSDGVVLRVLEKLLLLDGDRLSYRALDVEQIGSVYENMMGFRLEKATETSIGVGKEHVVVGLETLLRLKGKEREAHLKELANVELTGKGASEVLRSADSIDGLVAALGKRISPLTPRKVPPLGLFLQPTDERRRSGSHYTPRELTEPIVRTTLRPILEDLGPSPRPEALLALKLCDPAMGSGAFLVEACRQLAEQLVKAYDVHGRPADLRPDEDIQLYAQRQVAQRCLYGVDKNPFAVDLGKLALWLATLAKDHAFTFLDHALRHGDSLVGLSREQIASFHWAPEKQVPVIRALVDKAMAEATERRAAIHAMASSDDVMEKQRLLRDADEAIETVRTVGDVVVGCFFAEDKAKAREATRQQWEGKVSRWLGDGGTDDEIASFVRELREGEKGVPCFHWEVEFPEVFARENGGFDAVVGNPPFAGKNTIAEGSRAAFPDWLKALHEEAHGNADLVAHFYRRAFSVIRERGTFGLIATNTIGQGDTRATGLRWICTHGGEIYSATRRVKWPGLAAVVVSVVHVRRGHWGAGRSLDGRAVSFVSAFLFEGGGHDDPNPLGANAGQSFVGSYVLGMGFTFDDTDKSGAATPVAEMHRLIAQDPRNAERIFPYLGGDELNSSPTFAHHRYVINFGELPETTARNWPALISIVEAKVRPSRMTQGSIVNPARWWMFARSAANLGNASRGLDRVLAIARVGQHCAFGFLKTGTVFSEQLIVIPAATYASFCALQCGVHELWARFFSSSLEDRLRYTPSDCFETFPFPPHWQSNPSLEAAGQTYYDFRAALMIRNNEGLTKTYNRFHDPDESDPDIVQLRDLHAAMDRAVLDAYGWTDLQPTCQFLLDYEEDEDDDSAAPGARRKKKPWRYRWPDETRDEVLARLLELNAQRAKEEREAAAVEAAKPAEGGAAKRGRAKGKVAPVEQVEMRYGKGEK